MDGELEEGRLVPVWKTLNHPFPQRVGRNGFIAAARTLDFLPFDVLNDFSFTTVRLKYIATICKEIKLFRGIPVGRFLQRVPVQIEDFEQGEV